MVRVARLKREAATYIMLRRKGYSINKLSQIFGRSTSMIHRILKAAGMTGYTYIGDAYTRRKSWHKLDMRKSGGLLHTVEQLFQHKSIIKIFQAWIEFMDGVGEKPP